MKRSNMALKAIILGLVICLFQNSRALGPLAAEKQILSGIYENAELNTFIRPPGPKNTSGPVISKFNMYVRHITEIDEMNMDYKIQVTFRSQWNDGRLVFKNEDLRYLTLLDTEKLWIPDVFFSNEMEGQFHNILRPNILIRIYPNGDVLYSTRLSLKLRCQMDLSAFPFDTQTCSVIFGSYGYTTDDLVFLWKDTTPITSAKNIDLPNFHFSDYETEYCTSTTGTGAYSCLKLNIKFTRQWHDYLIRVYIPLALFVMLSWIPFWLDYRETTARVSIWVSLLLVMAITVASIAPRIPQHSFTMAIDVWIGFCWISLFAVLIEFALIAQVAIKEEKNPVGVIGDPTENNTQDSKLGKVGKWLNKYPSRIQKIDVISRVAFPIAFAIFNVIYWATYAKSG